MTGYIFRDETMPVEPSGGDDVVALQAAIDDVESGTRYSWQVFKPRASYKISAKLNLYANTEYDGQQALLQPITNQWFSALAVTNTDNVVIKNFRIDGNFGYGIEVIQSDYVTIANNTITNIGQQLVAPNEEGMGIWAGGSFAQHAKNLRIINNNIENILGFGGSRGDSIYLTFYDDAIITGNICNGTQRQGIAFTSGVNESIISNNVIRSTALAGIDIEPNATYQETDPAKNLVITSNVIMDYGNKSDPAQAGSQFHGVTLNGFVENTTVSNNVIVEGSATNSPQTAIYFKRETKGAVAVGNAIETADVGVNANHSNPPARDWVVVGNSMRDISTNTIETYLNENNAVVGNAFADDTGPILISQSQTSIVGNSFPSAEIKLYGTACIVGNHFDDVHYNVVDKATYGMTTANVWKSEPRITQTSGQFGTDTNNNYNFPAQRTWQREQQKWGFAKFNGIDQWVDMSTEPLTSTQDATVCFWVYLLSDKTHGFWHSAGASGNRVASFSLDGDLWQLSYDGTYRIAPTLPIPIGKWVHVVYIQDATFSRESSVDQIVGTTVESVSSIRSETRSIGRYKTGGGTSHYLNGYIRDLQVYSRQLPVSDQLKVQRGDQLADCTHRYLLETDLLDSVGTLHGIDNGVITFGSGVSAVLEEVTTGEIDA